MKLKDKIVELKEERSLMTRFIIASRTRTEIQLPEIFGTYESTVVPRAMSSPDGRLLHCIDKTAVMHGIDDIVQATESADNFENIAESQSNIDSNIIKF